MIYNEWDGSRTYLSSLLRYLRGPGRDHILDRARFLGGYGFNVPVGISDDDWRFASRAMRANASPVLDGPTKKMTKPVLHVVLSWDRGQQVTDDDMRYAVSKMAIKIQMGEEQYQHIIVRHTEKKHPHAHVIFIRRNTYTGAAAPSHQRRMRGWNFAVEYDRERRDKYGIPIPSGLQFREDIAQAALQKDYNTLCDMLGKSLSRTIINRIAAFAGMFAEQQTLFYKNWAKELEYVPGALILDESIVLKRPVGEHPDALHWASVRAKRLVIADYCCETCSTPSNLECHHRNYVRFGAELVGDVLILCRACHEAVTRSIRERRVFAE
jgi:hypothetical protein